MLLEVRSLAKLLSLKAKTKAFLNCLDIKALGLVDMRDFGGEISSMLSELKCLDRLCLNTTFLFFALSFSFANYWSVANAQQPETTTEQITNSSDGVFETQEQTASVNVRLRALQERINELKENVFRSKARLVLLRETVLNSSLSGSQLVIHHRNEMGSSYRIQRSDICSTVNRFLTNPKKTQK